MTEKRRKNLVLLGNLPRLGPAWTILLIPPLLIPLAGSLVVLVSNLLDIRLRRVYYISVDEPTRVGVVRDMWKSSDMGNLALTFLASLRLTKEGCGVWSPVPFDGFQSAVLAPHGH